MMWRELLLFFASLTAGAIARSQLQLGRGSSVMPPYMLNLYNRLKEDRVLPHGTANTIRSFLPVPGNLGERDVLVFNMTGVHQSEYIERSELHLRWNKLPQSDGKLFKRKNRVTRLILLNLNQQSVPELQISPLIRRSGWGGWHTLDVTDAVISCLEDEHQDNFLIGVALHKEDDDDETDVQNIFSTAFLVVFSEDDDNLAIADIKDKMNKTVRQRDRRGLLDNELPDSTIKTLGNGAVAQARLKHKLLDTVQQGKKKKRRQNKNKGHPPVELKWRKNWWKTGKQRGDEEDDDGENDAKERSPLEDNQQMCQKKSFVVDFAKIGWNDWVIAPKRFDAFMCDGDCSFPLQQETQPSNYASLQGLFWPQPHLCCVPHSLTAVPLLFYDQNRNVVLKKFPAMKVQSCACR